MMTVTIPKTHPRAESLLIRQRLVSGFERGLVASEGLLAHGRGEAFDYLVGEQTTGAARAATSAAAACLLLAQRPVISVNGNFAALCPGETVSLAEATGAKIEVNIFYDEGGDKEGRGGGGGRRQRIIAELQRYGAAQVLGGDGRHSVRLSGLDSPRRTVDKNGIYSADAVLIPLEDGDRAEALVAEGKTVIAFDLNPLSRTAQKSSITIVDNVTRGMPALVGEAQRLSEVREGEKAGDRDRRLGGILGGFDNGKNLGECIGGIMENLAGEGGDRRGDGVA